METQTHLCLLLLQELFEPLHLMYISLLSTGDESTANHKLLDTLRQVGTAQRMHRTRQTGQQCMQCTSVWYCRKHVCAASGVLQEAV
jgi:hypothetical protein